MCCSTANMPSTAAHRRPRHYSCHTSDLAVWATTRPMGYYTRYESKVPSTPPKFERDKKVRELTEKSFRSGFDTILAGFCGSLDLGVAQRCTASTCNDDVCFFAHARGHKRLQASTAMWNTQCSLGKWAPVQAVTSNQTTELPVLSCKVSEAQATQKQ
eukprot:2176750-Amphidinium_carterae.2